jgi:hypothetical protein
MKETVSVLSEDTERSVWRRQHMNIPWDKSMQTSQGSQALLRIQI